MTTELPEETVTEIFRRLSEAGVPSDGLPDAKSDADLFRALVGCLLSAQSLDSNTLKAKTQLFSLADTPEGIVALDDAVVAAAIKPCGLYNVKTRNLKKLCLAVIERDGTIPRDRKGLMSLPGIGRKCADIVMRFSLGGAVIAVDTHIFRVCNRSGLALGKTEAQTAEALDRRAPDWAKRDGHLWLLEFGKRTCRARAPKCGACLIRDLCIYPQKTA